MLTRYALIAVLALSGAVQAEPDPAAKAVLEGMAEAIKAAKSISYKSELKGEGAMFSMFVPKHKSTVQMTRNPEGTDLWFCRIEGKAEMTGQPASEYLLVSDGIRKAWKDDAARQVVERFNPSAASPAVEMATKAASPEMVDAAKLVKEMNVPTMTLEKAQQVDGVMCDVVLCDVGDSRSQRRFFISQTDRLPRRIEHKIVSGGLDDAEVWLLTEIKLNEEIPTSSFAISTPEGWAFSPATPPPAPAAVAPAIPAQGATTITRPRAVGVNPQDLAPDFELTDSKGEKVKLSALKDNVVVLDFWGTWCLPCIKAGPELQKLTEEFKDKPVKVYGLAVRDPIDEKPINYMRDHKYTYGLLLKADEVAKTYHVKGFPTYVVIGKAGEIVLVTGLDEKIETTFANLRAAINSALEGKALGGDTQTITRPNSGSTGDDSGKPAKSVQPSDGGK